MYVCVNSSSSNLFQGVGEVSQCPFEVLIGGSSELALFNF